MKLTVDKTPSPKYKIQAISDKGVFYVFRIKGVFLLYKNRNIKDMEVFDYMFSYGIL